MEKSRPEVEEFHREIDALKTSFLKEKKDLKLGNIIKKGGNALNPNKIVIDKQK